MPCLISKIGLKTLSFWSNDSTSYSIVDENRSVKTIKEKYCTITNHPLWNREMK